MFYQQCIRLFKDIFLEEKIFSEIKLERKDLTDHYHQDLPYCFLDRISVASHYRESKKIIERYKYESDREYRERLVDFYLHIAGIEFADESTKKNWCIVPVPMHWSRYILRGFDHIGLLATLLSEKIGIPYQTILKTRYRPRQSRLNRTSRLANKTNAFRLLNGLAPIPEYIILIDDVISSGSTANACAEVLKQA